MEKISRNNAKIFSRFEEKYKFKNSVLQIPSQINIRKTTQGNLNHMAQC
jgi:hypothetical protein